MRLLRPAQSTLLCGVLAWEEELRGGRAVTRKNSGELKSGTEKNRQKFKS